MPPTKADIISQLKKEILPLQGFKPIINGNAVDVGLGPIKEAFPYASFPLGAIHEFLSGGPEDAAATSGFVAGIVASLMRNNGVCIWISSSRMIFPPALAALGIQPHKVIFADLQKKRDILWTMEEALRCEGLAAVVGEIPEISFAASRRLQLAVERSRVTGFLLRQNSHNISTTACISRWKITPLPSGADDDLPGVSFPRWNVQLLKARNGKPGSWQVMWMNEGFQHVYHLASISREQQKKTG